MNVQVLLSHGSIDLHIGLSFWKIPAGRQKPSQRYMKVNERREKQIKMKQKSTSTPRRPKIGTRGVQGSRKPKAEKTIVNPGSGERENQSRS